MSGAEKAAAAFAFSTTSLILAAAAIIAWSPILATIAVACALTAGVFLAAAIRDLRR